MKSDIQNADGYNADEWGQYCSLSTLAVVALLLGLCSALVFVSPLMIVVPLAAVATAVLALKGISASGGSLSGARLARCGLALAILFAVTAFARVKVRDTLLRSQADRVGKQWLAFAAEGRAEPMLEMMTKAASNRLMPTEEAGLAVPFFGKVLASASIRQDPLVLKLSELSSDKKLGWDLQESDIIMVAGKQPQAAFRYVIRNQTEKQQDCFLVLKRFAASDREAVWLVDSWALE